jgi:ubiquinol-cytochrome c reductase cytochrome b subunit
MNAKTPSDRDVRVSSRVFEWVELRLKLAKVRRILLDEPIPGGARWAYVFGSGLLFLQRD